MKSEKGIKESKKRREERIQNAAFLRTRIVESKKNYNRKKEKQNTKKILTNLYN